jgi:glycerol-3-phosphate dehydrogenase
MVESTQLGNLLLGPTSRGAGEGRLNQRDIIQLILSSARQSIPDFDPSQAITSYTGLRAKCSRGDFIVEESTVVPGFINAAGIDSPGLTSSPAVAKLVVDLLKRPLKEMFGTDLKSDPSFEPNRRAIVVPKSVSFRGAIDHANPSSNIICRCEKVTESEIVDAIHRPLGAHDTDAVKRRTRAGMGPCQGDFCESRVASLLSRELGVPVSQIGRHSTGSSILPHRRLNDEDKQLLKELALAKQQAKL